MTAIPRIIMCFGALALATAAAHGAELNPAAVAFKLPDQIERTSPSANAVVQQSVLVGDPAKAGLYMVLTKWLPGHMSRSHFHPNDRFITVLKGT